MPAQMGIAPCNRNRAARHTRRLRWHARALGFAMPSRAMIFFDGGCLPRVRHIKRTRSLAGIALARSHA